MPELPYRPGAAVQIHVTHHRNHVLGCAEFERTDQGQPPMQQVSDN